MTSRKQALVHHWKKERIITDEKVLRAFLEVPREQFLPEELQTSAYDDDALPLMEAQTISQPTTVMIMTQALVIKPGNKILEVGTGSGYQAAILSFLAGKEGRVITLEILPNLATFAKENLKPYTNVTIIRTDGSLGYEPEEPYDRIIVTAACNEIPQPLIEQLTVGGILVAPVGTLYEQQMIKLIKHKDTLEKESLGFFGFVPLQGKHGFFKFHKTN